MQTIHLTRVPLSRLPVVLITQTIELVKEGYVHMVRHEDNQCVWMATDPAPIMNVDNSQWDLLDYIADANVTPELISQLPNWLVLDIDANTLTNTALKLVYHYVPIDSLL
jgi:hypothetical protein